MQPRQQVLNSLDAPFSFYKRNKERAAASRAAAEAAAKEQSALRPPPPFKAKPVPAFIRKVLLMLSSLLRNCLGDRCT